LHFSRKWNKIIIIVFIKVTLEVLFVSLRDFLIPIAYLIVKNSIFVVKSSLLKWFI
jgi:hypothetical protein